jgi:hypothetical protein
MGLGVKGLMLLLAIGLAHAQPAKPQEAAADPWYSLNPRPRDFEPAKGQLGKFTIDLPKDWIIVPGHDGVLFTAAERPKNNQSAAAIVLEQMQLQGSVGPKDVTATLAEAELSAMRDRQPNGQNFAQQVKDTGGRRFIFIQYSKPGWSGPESVVQYSIPAGAVIYRIICIAPTAQLPTYQPRFAHVAASFKAPGAGLN